MPRVTAGIRLFRLVIEAELVNPRFPVLIATGESSKGSSEHDSSLVRSDSLYI